MDVHDYIRELWHEKFNPEFNPDGDELSKLRQTEWSPAFEMLMRSRLLIGAIRYGRMGSSSKPKYDRVNAAIQRLRVYAETGNLEMLVDVANFMMLEFVEGRHPKRCLYVHVDSEKVRKEKP